MGRLIYIRIVCVVDVDADTNVNMCFVFVVWIPALHSFVIKSFAYPMMENDFNNVMVCQFVLVAIRHFDAMCLILVFFSLFLPQLQPSKLYFRYVTMVFIVLYLFIRQWSIHMPLTYMERDEWVRIKLKEERQTTMYVSRTICRISQHVSECAAIWCIL